MSLSTPGLPGTSGPASRTSRPARTAAWCVAALTAVSPLLLAPAAQAAPRPVQDDFNGDGYRDLAVGAPYAEVNGTWGAGAVVILYGSSTGVSTTSTSATRRTVLTQGSPGVPGAVEEGDSFGAAIASADLDRDGYTDLLVGSDRETVGTREGRGSVTVVWGGAKGLTASGATLPAPAFTEWATFGENIAAGDFDGDGAVDLSVAARDGATHYKGPFTRAGVPAHRAVDDRLGTTHNIISGDLSGDGVPERIFLAGSVDGDINGQVRIDRWTGTQYVRTELPAADGLSGAVGDINGDGYGDLALGAPLEPDAYGSPGSLGGRVSVWYGGPGGPDTTQKPRVITQDTAGVPGASEAWDQFGGAVSVADTNADGYADVSVSAAMEDVGSQGDAGSVVMLYGSASGLTTTGSRALHQDTAGVPGTAEQDDYFGEGARLIDLDNNGRAELAVGAFGENDQTGMLTVLRSSTAGITTTSPVSVTAPKAGLSGPAFFGRVFGR